MNILFTCIGRRVELVQEFKKLSSKDFQVCIYGTDITQTAPALVFCDKAFIVPPINEAEYIPSLLGICKEQKIDLVIPTIDTDLLQLSLNKEGFEAIGTKVLICDSTVIRKCRDKRITKEFFDQAGLKYPESFDDIELYPMIFPAFIKPLDGSSSIDAYKVLNREDLYAFSRRIEKCIVQPYIDGEEYTVDIMCDFKGSPIFITPRKRLEVRAGEVTKTEICQDIKIIDEIKGLIKTIKPCGPLTVQLIKERTTGDNWYIEINPRFGGGVPLTMKAGANSAKAVVELMSGKSVDYNENAAENHVIYVRFDQSARLSYNNDEQD